MKLTNNSIARIKLMEKFEEAITGIKISDVAVIGGTRDEPELRAIKKYNPNLIVKFYGLETDDIFFNLNQKNEIEDKFDLVLCTNVLEHIYDHENFASNISKLVKYEGYLWMAFPFSDMFHLSPGFYSSGFHPDYVSQLFLKNSLIPEKQGIIGSRRLYLFTHFLLDWPSEHRYKYPLWGQVVWGLGLRGNPRPPIRNLSLKKLFACLILGFFDKKFNEYEVNGCSAWIFAQKI